jgi:hypothetical protein
MNGRGWRRAALLAVAVGSAACASKREAAAVSNVPLACELSVAPRVAPGEPMLLRFRLTNRTAQPLYVLDWHTPLEGLLSRMLQVSRAGQDIPYQGPMMKRGDPGADDYRAIAPGASVEESIDVGLAYETQAPGRYRIAFAGPLRDVVTSPSEVPRPLDKHQPMAVQCPAVETERLAR